MPKSPVCFRCGKPSTRWVGIWPVCGEDHTIPADPPMFIQEKPLVINRIGTMYVPPVVKRSKNG